MKADIDQKVADIGFARPQYGPAFASRTATNENSASVSVAEQSNVGQFAASKLSQSSPVKDSSVSVEELNQAADTIEEFLGRNQRNLTFERNLDSGKMVISVIDRESKDIIRTIPSEEAIEVASRIKDLQDELIPSSGVIFERKV